MIRSDQIQTTLVQYLKTLTAITLQLDAGGSSSDEIREDSWQGTEFVYPNIRVRMMPVKPEGNCDNRATFEASLMAFSEKDSSLQCDTIAGIIANTINGRNFTNSGVHLWVRVTSLIPAIRVDSQTWRAECLVSGGASLV